MNYRAVLSICGLLLLIFAGALLLPLLVAFVYGETSEYAPILTTIAVCGIVGAAGYWLVRPKDNDLGSREGFAIVAFGWVILSAFGALPFWLSENGIPRYLDAYFETMSGFTTTGASILNDIEALPKCLLFWRAMTHWLGGMGIVVLTVAILPFLGAGGYQMLRAEVPGPTADKLKPRIAETAGILWGVYLLLTLAETLLLWLAPEMTFFDAICHAFATLATGGFSTKNASVAAFDSLYIDVVITIFMVLAGANFVLHYSVMFRGKLPHFRDAEFKLYAFIFVAATIFFSVLVYAGEVDAEHASFGRCVRDSAFQVAALLTTTGFATADYETWPNACRIVIVLLMVSGGCAGSTGGGVKVIRLLVVAKYGIREIQRLVRPHAVLPVKIGGVAVEKETVARVMGFVALYLVIFFFSVLAMSMILESPEHVTAAEANRSAVTAFGSVLATLGNIGPGFADVGPTENFAAIPDTGKILLTFLMLVGRLEIYSVLVILIPLTWRK